MERGGPDVQFAFRTADGWQRNLLIGLFALYVLESIAQYTYGDVVYQVLGWTGATGWSAATTPWQPLTRFLVQGPDVFWVVVALLVLYFALPAVTDAVSNRDLGNALLAGAVGGTVLPFVVDLSVALPQATS